MNKETQLTAEQIEAILDEFNVDSTDFMGTFPIDLNALNFCEPSGEIPVPNMSMEEIEELCNSDFILNLLDKEKMEATIKNMVDDAVAGKKPADFSIEGNYAIVEFGDDYTNGDKVNYQLFIKPGQQLTTDTIIGEVEQKGKMLPLKSIFKSGKVLAIKNEKGEDEFLHLYPSKATRHFIVVDYQVCDNSGYDEKAFTKIGDDINDNTDLYNLIKDHLCQSALPLILSNHETKEEHMKWPVDPNTFIKLCPNRMHTPAIELYNNRLMREYEEIIEKYTNEIKKIVSADSIKAANGKKSEMHSIKDRVLKARHDLLEEIITLYKIPENKGYNTLEYNDYIDCINLGSYEYKDAPDIATIRGEKYNNYYMYLISTLNLNGGNKYVKEYYKVLSSIMLKRALYEKSERDDLIKEFNTLFKKHIKTNIPKNILNNTTSQLNITVDIPDVSTNTSDTSSNMMDSSANNTDSSSNNSSTNASVTVEFSWFNYILNKIGDSTDFLKVKDAIINEDKITIATYKNNEINKKLAVYNQLTNIFIYINSSENVIDDNKLEFTDEFTAYDLVLEEANILKNFWASIIQKYEAKPISGILNNMQSEIDKISSSAQWPAPSPITIEEQEYAHYLFMNPMPDELESKNDGDNGIADYDDNNTNTKLPDEPEIPSVSEEDAAASLNSGDAARNSDNDPTDKEITIVDTEYWVKYFTLATVISLPPIYWASGFDVPPTMTPIPMPGIYIAFKAIHIKIFDVVLVIGLAIRGIYIFPVLLTVNLSDQDASPLTPLIAILKLIKFMFDAGIELIEGTVPNIIGLIVYKLELENAQYRQANQMYESLLKALENLSFENDELLKKHMRKLVLPMADFRQNILRPEEIAINGSSSTE